ncbi:MAG TPA: hypothetical protein VFM18_10910 [Methanosarcina sp.]|nr:hypothetical protein [Methanosarcina sp.]
MNAKNDITGDSIISKVGNMEAFEKNFDLIFGEKKKECNGCFTCDECENQSIANSDSKND